MKGENKLIKKIQGISLINYSVKNILDSSIDELIIVLGYQNEITEKIIDKNEKIKFVFNKNFQSGMASSIKTGLNHLPKETKAFFISLGDMPLIGSKIYNQLINSKNKNEIIIPTYKGQAGNPVLFSISMKERIKTIQGDIGAKKIIELNKKKVLTLEVDDPGITKDFNIYENFNS